MRKFCNAKQTKLTHHYKNIKTKLYKNNAAIWYNKTCRKKQLTPNYICIKVNLSHPNLRTKRSSMQSDMYQMYDMIYDMIYLTL